MTFAVVAILGHFSKTMLLFMIPQVSKTMVLFLQTSKTIIQQVNKTMIQKVPSTSEPVSVACVLVSQWKTSQSCV